MTSTGNQTPKQRTVQSSKFRISKKITENGIQNTENMTQLTRHFGSFTGTADPKFQWQGMDGRMEEVNVTIRTQAFTGSLQCIVEATARPACNGGQKFAGQNHRIVPEKVKPPSSAQKFLNPHLSVTKLQYYITMSRKRNMGNSLTINNLVHPLFHHFS